MHRTAPTIKNYLALNVNGSKVRNPALCPLLRDLSVNINLSPSLGATKCWVCCPGPNCPGPTWLGNIVYAGMLYPTVHSVPCRGWAGLTWVWCHTDQECLQNCIQPQRTSFPTFHGFPAVVERKLGSFLHLWLGLYLFLRFLESSCYLWGLKKDMNMPVALVCRPRRWHMCMDEKQLCIMLSSIMLSEISQAVKDKYHMISPLTGT